MSCGNRVRMQYEFLAVDDLPHKPVSRFAQLHSLRDLTFTTDNRS